MLTSPYARLRAGAFALCLALLAGAAPIEAKAPARRAPARPVAAPVLFTAPGHVAGMVSAADPRAAAAGTEILKAGGNATDAAIATLLALSVVEPQSTGLGGGGFLVWSDPKGKVETFDGREVAPAAATPDRFMANGKPMSRRDAVPGGLSVGVPGNIRLAALAHARHGKLAWRALFGPAIRLARDGIVVSPRLAASLDQFGATSGLDPAAKAVWFDAAGKPKAAGTLVRNPALAAMLEKIAAQGPAAFYAGANAAAISAKVSTSPHNPTPFTPADLAAYRVIQREPVCGRYRGYRVCGMGPPSAGGMIVLQALGMLERFDLKALGPDSPVAWHLIAEAERLAFADRDRHVGDPGFVRVPTAGLIDPAYIKARSALISPDRTIARAEPGTPQGMAVELGRAAPVEEHGTTHFVAVDRWGNVASTTSTVEGGFGSGLFVNGYYLNNQLTDFDFAPAAEGRPAANAVAAGKRPRSSMSPVVVFRPDGRLLLAGGGAGGVTIPPQVIRLLIGTIDWGLSARQAISLGIVMPFGESLAVEAGTPLEAMVPALTALGHAKVSAAPMRLKANAVEVAGGQLVGAADPRSEGSAVTP
jgi:gamma-glutamyltranspeptidase/glutathione hydrolase